MKSKTSLLLLACLVLAACNLQYAQAESTQAWIDAPLDGSNLPLAPYEIIFHAGAAGDPAAVELAINGQPVTLDSTVLAQPLVTVRYPWDPQAPGRYIITARTQDVAGRWSALDTHVVTIGGTTVTVAPIITVTISPTITLTPSPTPTLTPTPAVAGRSGPLSIAFVGASTNQFYFGGAACGPTSVTLQVQVSDPAQVTGVTLFYKLRVKPDGAYTDWNSDIDLRAQGNGTFAIALDSRSVNGIRASDNWFIYQFIGTGPNHQPNSRTQVFGDISLTRCGSGGAPSWGGLTLVAPPIWHDVATITPEIVK